MVALKKLIAPVLAGAALAFGSASAFALNVGEGSSYPDMVQKLGNEQQVEIINAATGNNAALRGLKFYYNAVTKVSYVGMTDNPVDPKKMKIIYKTSSTEPNAPLAVPEAILGIRACQKLIKEGAATDCASLSTRLENSKADGTAVFQYGTLPNGNALMSMVKLSSGVGVIYEVTPDGAAVRQLAFGNAKPTDDGTRLLASLPRKTAKADQIGIPSPQ